MRRRTQLYLDEDQYRWLKRQAGPRGSIAGVVRDLIDRARKRGPDTSRDPLIGYLRAPPAKGRRRTSVDSLDDELYGHGGFGGGAADPRTRTIPERQRRTPRADR